MNLEPRLFIFSLEGQRIALPLSRVSRAVPVVEITPLPEAPDIVIGIVNVHGRVIPVANIRRRFRMPEKEIDPGDILVLAETSRRPVAIIADRVEGVLEVDTGEVVRADEILPGIGHIEGVLKLRDGIVLIHDIDTFLSIEEERLLDSALKGIGGLQMTKGQ